MDKYHVKKRKIKIKRDQHQKSEFVIWMTTDCTFYTYKIFGIISHN